MIDADSLRLTFSELQTYLDLKRGSYQIPKDRVLRRLSTSQRLQTQGLAASFEEVLREDVRTGVLLMVGGAVYKRPLPRKDIDLVVVVGDIRYKDEGRGVWPEFVDLAGNILSRAGNDSPLQLHRPSSGFGYTIFGCPGRILVDTGRASLDIIMWNNSYDWSKAHRSWKEPHSVIAQVRSGHE